MTAKLRCAVCRKRPEEIEEYVEAAEVYEKMSPDKFVEEEEGTLDLKSMLFTCTDCYIKIGMPSRDGGWTPSGYAFSIGKNQWAFERERKDEIDI